jgi:hypothetical protein
MDGKIWTMIDQQTDTQTFLQDWNTASFAISNPMECRFIRLTQTDRRYQRGNDLLSRAVEFFGMLSE